MNHKKAILFGIGAWAFTFIVAMAAFGLRQNERVLFESIMPVALVLSTITASALYLKTVKSRQFYIGFCLGLIFLIVNLVLDSLLFSWGPMKMLIIDYLKDIGVAYLLIPIIPSGMGYLLEKSGK
ncbi:MAG TPA: hypothetical protein VIK81_00225 [Patescibacteria group bacterium]